LRLALYHHISAPSRDPRPAEIRVARTNVRMRCSVVVTQFHGLHCTVTTGVRPFSVVGVGGQCRPVVNVGGRP
jgi:hypothetical protein